MKREKESSRVVDRAWVLLLASIAIFIPALGKIPLLYYCVNLKKESIFQPFNFRSDFFRLFQTFSDFFQPKQFQPKKFQPTKFQPKQFQPKQH